jgi:hypothetical protein
VTDAVDPPLSPAEALTVNFYAWERRLRGWDVWPYAVALEPQFQPFYHTLPIATPGYDDGRTPGIADWLRGLWTKRDSDTQPAAAESQALDALPAPDDIDLVDLRVRCEEDVDVSPEVSERLLLVFGTMDCPVAYELVGAGGSVALQLAIAARDAPFVRHVLDDQIPGLTVETQVSALPADWQVQKGETTVVDFGLSREAVLPLRRFRSFAVDPLVPIISALHALRGEESAVLQVRFARTAYPWAESMLRAVSDGEGHAFFADAPELLPLCREKTASPLTACSIRVAARSPTGDRTVEIVRSLSRALTVVGDPAGNELIPLTSDGYPHDEHLSDLFARRGRRTGMLLSIAELAGLVHLPSASVRSPGLRAPPRRSKAAPACAVGGQDILGENVHRGARTTVHVSRDLRLRHMHVIGATGTGKSTLLLSLIRQDIEAGRGVGVIDPHGDLVDEVLALVPEARQGDVVLFDPADEVCPVGFNVLRAHTDREKDLLSSDLVAVFRRLATTWGDQMTAVLGNAVMAFLESDDGGTLLDLRRFLVDKGFREERLRAVRDPAVVSFFRHEFPILHGRPQASILTRLDTFLRPKQIRTVVAQRDAKLDLGSVMDKGQIFLARLAQGAIGEENAYLLGSLLVSKIHQMALARERLPDADRRDFFLYLDECHHFVTPSLSALLSGARKFHVGLVLAHQELRQLGDREVLSAILANAGTRVCFRVSDEDARKLAEGFDAFDAADLQRLGIGEAICRLERADQDCNIRVVRGDQPEHASAETRRAAIRVSSRARWGAPRAEVEAEIARAFEEQREAPRPPDVEQVEGPAATPSAGRQLRPLSGGALPLRSKAERSAERVSSSLGNDTPGGRGGPQHKYLQALIKRFGEDRGFRATLEAPVEGGGRIDVLLSRESLSIACEISISSTPAQEVENLRKCRAHGASRVILVSPERKTLRAVVKLMTPELQDGPPLSFCTPDDLLALLDGLVQPTEEREDTVRGYRVRTTVRPAEPGQRDDRKSRVAGTILGALKRLRNGG